MWVRSNNGRVAEVTHIDPAGRYHSEAEWVCVPEVFRPWVNASWVAVDGAVAPSSLEAFAEQLSGEVALFRRMKQGGGVDYDGHRYHSDAEGCQSITASLPVARAYDAEHGDGTWSMRWKAMDGWVDMTRCALEGISVALTAHIGACFAREEEITILLSGHVKQAGATPETTLALHADLMGAGWP